MVGTIIILPSWIRVVKIKTLRIREVKLGFGLRQPGLMSMILPSLLAVLVGFRQPRIQIPGWLLSS